MRHYFIFRYRWTPKHPS
jgi:hypothetical protein